jgi:hypothetical protein
MVVYSITEYLEYGGNILASIPVTGTCEAFILERNLVP